MGQIGYATGNSYVVIDMQKFKRNVEKIKASLSDGVTLLPVLKGSTCGHGLEEIAACLVNECGLEMLCVGHVIEAERIRAHGISCDILVLGGAPFNNIPYIVEHDLTTTVSNAEYARRLSAEAESHGKKAKVHLKINSGLGRMGVRPGEDLKQLLDAVIPLPGLDIEGAYTHFVDSSALDTTLIEQQIGLFDQGLAQIKNAGLSLRYCHAANTPATVRFPQYHYNMVRSLLLLVGFDWSIDQINRLGLETLIYWRAFVVQINEFKAGERFDYGHAITAERDMKVAVTSFGYSDGYPDDLVGNGAFVIIKGKRAPILSLNMDQGFVDVTDIDDVQVNDEMLLLGRDGDEEVSILELLGNRHGLPYVLCNINQRVRRIFKY